MRGQLCTDLDNGASASPSRIKRAAAKRLLERVFPPASDLIFAQPTLDELFGRVLTSEAPLTPRFGLPFGLSVVALARAPIGAWLSLIYFNFPLQ